jgi:EAL domain-containing protein (putative c-di-GMP-specific phosphodiesterase class I)
MNLLVLDDEPQICRLVERVATRAGFRTRTLSDPREFAGIYREILPHLVMLDLQMPGMDGIEILRVIAAESHKAKVLISSGADRRVLKVAGDLATSHGLDVVGVLPKPLSVDALEQHFADVLTSEQPISAEMLQTAIQEDRLLLHYQPQVEFQDGRWRVTGAEALVRWSHPVRGLISPVDFIPMAESEGQILRLTDFVLRTAARQLAHWGSRGLPYRLSVNCSANLMDDLGFPDRLRELVREFGIDPTRLVLELTESAVMAKSTTAMDVLARVRLLGIGLSIDDFGTGNSSFMRLYEMPFNELKVDRSFVLNTPRDHDARTIVRATVDLAHALGMTVCAEGVESEAMLTYLARIGCDSAQGYLIGRPVPAEEFQDVVNSWHGRPPVPVT